MDPFLAQLKDIPSRELTIHYMNHCMELSGILKSQGITLEPYNYKGLAQFNSLSLVQQERILNGLQTHLNQLRSALNANVELKGDNRRYAWWALKNMDLIPPEDLFDKIDHSHFIEIYNSEGIQVFRSFELYEHISYTLSEIFSFTWMELFERDQFVFSRMREKVADVLFGKSSIVENPNFPEHVVSEVFSQKRLWVKMRSVLISPLRTSEKKIGGLIYVFDITDHSSFA